MATYEVTLPGAPSSSGFGEQVGIPICAPAWIIIGTEGLQNTWFCLSSKKGVNGPLFESGVPGSSLDVAVFSGFWTAEKLYLSNAFTTSTIKVMVVVQDFKGFGYGRKSDRKSTQ